MFPEVMRQHEDGEGCTLTTNVSANAFHLAERMAFAGYSVKLSKDPGGDWVVIATKAGELNQHASKQACL